MAESRDWTDEDFYLMKFSSVLQKHIDFTEFQKIFDRYEAVLAEKQTTKLDESEIELYWKLLTTIKSLGVIEMTIKPFRAKVYDMENFVPKVVGGVWTNAISNRLSRIRVTWFNEEKNTQIWGEPCDVMYQVYENSQDQYKDVTKPIKTAIYKGKNPLNVTDPQEKFALNAQASEYLSFCFWQMNGKRLKIPFGLFSLDAYLQITESFTTKYCTPEQCQKNIAEFKQKYLKERVMLIRSHIDPEVINDDGTLNLKVCKEKFPIIEPSPKEEKPETTEKPKKTTKKSAIFSKETLTESNEQTPAPKVTPKRKKEEPSPAPKATKKTSKKAEQDEPAEEESTESAPKKTYTKKQKTPASSDISQPLNLSLRIQPPKDLNLDGQRLIVMEAFKRFFGLSTLESVKIFLSSIDPIRESITPGIKPLITRDPLSSDHDAADICMDLLTKTFNMDASGIPLMIAIMEELKNKITELVRST
jgi:hypothetical protein